MSNNQPGYIMPGTNITNMKKVIIMLLVIYAIMLDVVLENECPLWFAVVFTAVYTAITTTAVIGVVLSNKCK